MISSRALLIGKALYFFLFAAMGIFVPFLNVYFDKDIGLSKTQIGLIGTLGPLIAIFSGPLWGLLSDRLGRMRLLLAGVALGAAASALGLSAMKSLGDILLMAGVFNLFVSAIMPLVDSYNISLLGEQRERYSEQRIWGTVGFLFTSTFAGFLMDYAGRSVIFWGYAICVGLFALSLTVLPPAPARMNRAVFKGFTEMMRQPVWIIFAASVILVMMANSSWINFLGIAMKQMGASDGLVGTAWSLGAVAELPVMWLGTRLLHRLRERKMIALGFFFYGLRLVLYAVMPVPEWALAISLLHGLSFGFYWIGGVNYVSRIAPEHLRATGQSMLGTFFSIASVTSGPVMGYVFDQSGSTPMFLLAAAIAWMGVGIFILGRNQRPVAEPPLTENSSLLG